MDIKESEARNDCVGDGQQQFNWLLTEENETQNDCAGKTTINLTTWSQSADSQSRSESAVSTL
jgi:hypothetical protein